MTYVCMICGYRYDPAKGDPGQGIPPGTPFEDLPEHWVCPVCGAETRFFEPMRETERTRPSAPRTVVIVGNGVAGFTVAHELVSSGGGSFQVHLVANEPHHYYPRPPLARVVAGQLTLDDLVLYESDWYDRQGIQTFLGNGALSIDRREKAVTLADGTLLRYDALVLANGSQPAVPPIENVGLRGVFTLRTVDDALAIRRHALARSNAVVVGGGLLGLEAAKALLDVGMTVQVVEVASTLLPRQLDADAGALLERLLAKHGLVFRTRTRVKRLLGQGEVSGVEVEGGEVLPAELVFFAVGIVPQTSLARTAGLTCNRGVVVNDALQTDDPSIYACGDVAEHRGRVYGIVPAALDQARVVAKRLLGEEALYEGTVANTTLKVAGVGVTSAGDVHAEGADIEHVKAARPERGIYRKFVLRNGVAIGAVAVGLREQMARIVAAVEKRLDLSKVKAELENPDYDLSDLL